MPPRERRGARRGRARARVAAPAPRPGSTSRPRRGGARAAADRCGARRPGRAPPSPARPAGVAAAVSVTAAGAVQRHVGEEPALGRDAGLARPVRPSRSGAPRPGRRSTGWRATGCRDRPAGGCAAPAWRCPPRLRGSGKAAVGVVAGHRVEARPERGDLVALRVRREMLGGAQGVLNERVLLHRRQHDAGRLLDRGHEVRRAG